jgi:hypothetical protein
LEAFKIDYSKVKIEKFDFTKIDPITINSQPIFQFLKSVRGLSKVLLTRMDSEGSLAATNFLLTAYSKLLGCEVDHVLYSSNIYHDLT